MSRHAVYNSLGVEFGYYDTLADLANGVIHYKAAPGKSLEGMQLEPPALWSVDCGFFAVRKSAAACLLSQGIYPTWPYTQADVDRTPTGPNAPYGWDTLGADVSGLVAPLALDFTLPEGFTFPGAGDGTKQPIDWQKIGLIGAGGLVGLLVLNKLLNRALA